MDEPDSQAIEQETPADDVFIPPSINHNQILNGFSYTHHTAIPEVIADDSSIECVLGVDEAGRGPVLGLHLPHINRHNAESFSKAPWYIACFIFLFHVIALCSPKPIISMIQRFSLRQFDHLSCKNCVLIIPIFSRIVDGRQD